MSDLLRIQGLKLFGRHGVTEEERAASQAFELDLEVSYDQRRAAATDRLEEAVDVRIIVEKASEVIERSESSALLEALAQRVADAVLDLSQVREVLVRLGKMEARLFHDRTHPYQVEIRRTREEPEEAAPGDR